MRCAGHVLMEGNSHLNDKELEMIVILQMNRKFMEFMRRMTSISSSSSPSSVLPSVSTWPAQRRTR